MAKFKGKKIRYAVVGLGHIAQVAVLPAFKHSKNSELVALISEDPEKLKKIGKMYKVPKERCFNLSDFPQCLTTAGVDVVYIATPNNTHHKLVIQALNVGVNVLCEKPLAISVKECEEMIEASETNNRLLMTAYRLHFEQSNLEIIKLAQSKKLGELRIFNSTFTMQVTDKDNIRLSPTHQGGGPIWDIGIYCLNAVRSIFKDEPTEVVAFASSTEDERFKKTDEMVSVLMKFPQDRLASFVCSFGADSCANYDLIGTKGRVHLEKAYEYASGREMVQLKDDEKPKKKKYPKADQFAAELDYFSSCVLNNNIPEPSAIEGKADIRVIEAILQSIKTGQVVKLGFSNGAVHPDPKQMIIKPPVKKPKTIKAKSPH
jgi:predicted dehydrogenase